jgi:hypothetical protein
VLAEHLCSISDGRTLEAAEWTNYTVLISGLLVDCPYAFYMKAPSIQTGNTRTHADSKQSRINKTSVIAEDAR